MTTFLNSSCALSTDADFWVWNKGSTRVYSAHSGYEQVVEHPNIDEISPEWVELVWNKWAPLKVILFAWKAFQNRIPLLPNLQKRNIIHQELAVTCKQCNKDQTETREDPRL